MPVIESDPTRNIPAGDRVRTRRLRVGGFALAALVTLLTGCAGGSDDDVNIVRTTTNIAGAAVVGIERDTRTACSLPTPPDQSAGPHTAGGTQVPADPRRIVVLDTTALDAVCAVGLWERVVGAATLDGPVPQPAYLGTGVVKIPSVGGIGSPDPAKIAALQPDLILGTTAAGADALRGIAPTVLVGSAPWQAQFSALADGMNRAGAAEKILGDYRITARDTGTAIAASYSQASVIRFSANDIQVLGDNSFAGQVLADAGVQRPGAQRGHTFQVSGVASEDERERVEGDIIYLMFDGPDGKSNGQTIMKSKDWKKLGAVADRREFAVDDVIWHGSGVTAARALLEDLRNTLNGFVTD
ncbi:iron-siderophore ABC transporter substrate-binding protein [Nocardia sp. CDC159]|uniref:Iron-siderophore ABC transporter substrate-binding protein n=1 Tax=Nocardia pulmonis TaxID=2951408 RepID=A0A9X2IYL2_9NOCA|nr:MULTISPECIES: iron-siderophore ABC transporter substrate-binding protein [Nocardia]MCM6776483.1 iron-siderophore ABC transporter substrate-binding protein [Nocardia pulmonis]MCM6788907.1 iron-siderophore ABC transporter substrate-binding protein [Nocardia sp. CDC159]